MERNNFYSSTKVKSFIWLSLKFAIMGAIISVTVHLIVQGLRGISYTFATGLLLGFLVGAVEPWISKIRKIPFSTLLLIRTVIYFLVVIISTGFMFLIYLMIHDLQISSLTDLKILEVVKREAVHQM